MENRVYSGNNKTGMLTHFFKEVKKTFPNGKSIPQFGKEYSNSRSSIHEGYSNCTSKKHKKIHLKTSYKNINHVAKLSIADSGKSLGKKQNKLQIGTKRRNLQSRDKNGYCKRSKFETKSEDSGTLQNSKNVNSKDSHTILKKGNINLDNKDDKNMGSFSWSKYFKEICEYKTLNLLDKNVGENNVSTTFVTSFDQNPKNEEIFSIQTKHSFTEIKRGCDNNFNNLDNPVNKFVVNPDISDDVHENSSMEVILNNINILKNEDKMVRNLCQQGNTPERKQYMFSPGLLISVKEPTVSSNDNSKCRSRSSSLGTVAEREEKKIEISEKANNKNYSHQDLADITGLDFYLKNKNENLQPRAVSCNNINNFKNEELMLKTLFERGLTPEKEEYSLNPLVVYEILDCQSTSEISNKTNTCKTQLSGTKIDNIGKFKKECIMLKTLLEKEKNSCKPVPLNCILNSASKDDNNLTCKTKQNTNSCSSNDTLSINLLDLKHRPCHNFLQSVECADKIELEKNASERNFNFFKSFNWVNESHKLITPNNADNEHTNNSPGTHLPVSLTKNIQVIQESIERKNCSSDIIRNSFESEGTVLFSSHIKCKNSNVNVSIPCYDYALSQSQFPKENSKTPVPYGFIKTVERDSLILEKSGSDLDATINLFMRNETNSQHKTVTKDSKQKSPKLQESSVLNLETFEHLAAEHILKTIFNSNNNDFVTTEEGENKINKSLPAGISSENLLFDQKEYLLNLNEDVDSENRAGGSQKACQEISKSAILEENLLFKNNMLELLTEENDNSKENKKAKHSQTSQNSQNLYKKNKCYIKRYKKGKTKIYKLKRRLMIDKTRISSDEDLVDVFSEQVTQKSRDESLASICTNDSYETDASDNGQSDAFSVGSKCSNSPRFLLRKGLNKILRDKSLIFSNTEDQIPIDRSVEEIQAKIQQIFDQVVNDFKNRKRLQLIFRRQTLDNCVMKSGSLQMKPLKEAKFTKIKPASANSPIRFNLILFILHKVRTLLETNTKLTKREIYYQLKTLVRHQGIIDKAINTVSCLLDVGMWSLNITAQKGLVFGNLNILLSSGERINCNVPGTLIPQDVNDIIEIQSSAYFILVVEKESIFHKLLEENLPNRLTRPFVMITGKGFPDLNTQLFLKKLWMIMSVPVFILVDADPDGISIMLNYKYGSVANAHVSEYLTVPKAKWLGVFPSEILKLDITKENLTDRECKKVQNLLDKPYVKGDKEIVKELNILLETKLKAGIEGLLKTNTFLSNVYLPTKLYSRNYI